MPEHRDAVPVAGHMLLDGRYRLIERIATGGTGEVWKAGDELLDHRVAVKVLKAGYAADPDFRARFKAEARHAAMLSHPGIARVYDHGRQDDVAYLVMEYLSGSSLAEILTAGPLEPLRTMEIVGQVARAIQVAHDADVIHRDLKPANLLVSPDGVVKVTDFGTARVLATEGLTQPGMIVGTARYLSPEQAQGLELGPATDIYSLGLVAYECLTGEPPFDGKLPSEVAFAHIHDLPPALPDTVPADVRAVVERCLAKTPDRRPSSMAELAQLTDRIRGLHRGRHGSQRATRPLTAIRQDRRPSRRRPQPSGPTHRAPRAGRHGTLAGVGGLGIVLVSGFVISSSAAVVLPMMRADDHHRPTSSSTVGSKSPSKGPAVPAGPTAQPTGTVGALPVPSDSHSADATDATGHPTGTPRHRVTPTRTTHRPRPRRTSETPRPTHTSPDPSPTRSTATPTPTRTAPTPSSSPSDSPTYPRPFPSLWKASPSATGDA